MTSPLTATAAPVLAPLLSAAVRAPVWITVPLFALGAAAVVIHLVLLLRAAREQERATRHTEQRRTALEEEVFHAARTITDPTERTDALLGLASLHTTNTSP
ncbi:hypothetical protein [Embleya sp. NBC_00896]|uniref:hypothetical protein n=1 Tax=Embleya sp. NBC_00896 TaxID=2975961 RepID=UPI002F9115B0|nr:hypothetical protein OG928_46860 [Embleya sp. NBC_00896]